MVAGGEARRTLADERWRRTPAPAGRLSPRVRPRAPGTRRPQPLRRGLLVLGILTRTIPVLLASVSAATAQEQPAEPSPPPPYQRLRYDEDYSYLADPDMRTDLWDPVKYIPLNERGDWRLSLGGEARERFEYYRNYRWDPDAPDQDGYLLQRYLFHADLHLGEAVRAFAQLQSSLEDFRAGGTRPTDENLADIHQLFGDIRPWKGEGE